jgi:hypothetical protein
MSATRVPTLSNRENHRLVSRIREVSGIDVKPPVEVVADTTDYMRIQRGQVIRVEGREFFVSGDVYEPRFGLEDQPKFWVKRAYDLASGRRVLMKLEFHEEFVAEVGPLHVPCFRSPEKEGRVLRLVAGDSRFMQGEMLIDSVGNHVRVIQWIEGRTLYNGMLELEMDHEEYYHTRLAPLLRKAAGSCEAIQMLHDHGLSHGDIRNDHILVDEETGEFRWIDFDLCQNLPGYDPGSFDVWSLGKVLQFVVGMGLTTFHELRACGRFPGELISDLQPEDAGALCSYRLMNLKKVYPYISDRLNAILMRFSVGAEDCYRTASELTRDLYEAIPEVPTDGPVRGL